MKITIITSEIEVSMEYPTDKIDVSWHETRATNITNITTKLITACSEKTIEILKVKNEQPR